MYCEIIIDKNEQKRIEAMKDYLQKTNYIINHIFYKTLLLQKGKSTANYNSTGFACAIVICIKECTIYFIKIIIHQ